MQELEVPGLYLSLADLQRLPLQRRSRLLLWRLGLERVVSGLPEGQGLPQGWVALCLQLLEEGQAEAEACCLGDDRAGFTASVALLPFCHGLGERLPSKGRSALMSQLIDQLAAVSSQLIGLLHRVLVAEQLEQKTPVDPAEWSDHAEWLWCSWLLLEQHRRWQLHAPDWLEPVEEQLVRTAALCWRQQASGTQQASVTGMARQRALTLLQHLATLHEPCPPWIALAIGELGGNRPARPETVSSIPETVSSSTVSSSTVSSSTARVNTTAGVIRERQPDLHQQLLDGLQNLRAALLRSCSNPGRENRDSHSPESPGPLRLRLTYVPGQPLLSEHQGLGLFNLAPLITGRETHLVDRLIPDLFISLAPVVKAEMTALQVVLDEPESSLYVALQEQWQQGHLLPIDQFRPLIVATDLWRRHGGTEGFGARIGPVVFPSAELRAGGLLVRPGNVELAALRSVLLQSEQLTAALQRIQQRGHDQSWMEQQSGEWWCNPTDPLENLRRLHTNAGFYADSDAPLSSLQCWSEASIAALRCGDVVSAHITTWMYVVAQELWRRNGTLVKLVQWPGEEAWYRFIGGQELLVVSPLAADLMEQHRSGRAFQLFHDLPIMPYELRCLEAPISIYPNRPHRDFQASLDAILIRIDQAWQERPFQVFSAACGAYGLPLCQAVHERYGVASIYPGNILHALLGIEQRTTADWRRSQRLQQNWRTSDLLNAVPGLKRIEGGRYLSCG